MVAVKPLLLLVMVAEEPVLRLVAEEAREPVLLLVAVGGSFWFKMVCKHREKKLTSLCFQL